MKLYEIADSFRIIQELLDNESDESKVELLKDTLDAIEGDLEVKVENIVKYMKNLEAEAKAYKEEADRLSAKKKSVENKIEGLKNYLSTTLTSLNIKQVNAGIFKVKFQKSPASANIIDETKVPKKYKIKQPDKIDKKAILDDLKNGVKVKGCELINDKEHIRIG